jgi:hypothetical protein
MDMVGCVGPKPRSLTRGRKGSKEILPVFTSYRASPMLPSFLGGRRSSRTFLEFQRNGVHAVTQTRGLRAVVKHVTEMASALTTDYLFAQHTITVVGIGDHGIFCNRFVNTGPAGS